MNIKASYLDSNRMLWLCQVSLSCIGILDSGYLTWIKLSHHEASCIQGVGNCFSVNTSQYSELLGIPIALFGMMAYIAILLLLQLERRGGFWGNNVPLGVFGISLFGVLYSAYLTYLEIVVIKAICPFCLASALLMLSIFIISIIRLANSSSQS
ncbi:MAG: vitamin K epoxide reductase family protein [Anaerolineaceae bacterium]|nr:vitamin K epoxide reductase family protein [Anaerolineaceae bacterium]